MTRTAYPRVGGRTDDSQYSELFERMIGTGVRQAGDLAISADSTGLQVKAAVGFAVVSGVAFKSTAVETLAVTPNSTPNPRIDTVVLRRDFASSGLVVDFVVKPGAPAANPVPPSLEQDTLGVWEEPLADVRVDASTATLAAGVVTDRRRLMSVPVRTWTTESRPTGRVGVLGLNRSTGQWEAWDGNGYAAPNLDQRYYRRDETYTRAEIDDRVYRNARATADDAWNRANNAQGRADYAASVAEGRATYDYVNGVRAEFDNGRIDWRVNNLANDRANERINDRGLRAIASGALQIAGNSTAGIGFPGGRFGGSPRITTGIYTGVSTKQHVGFSNVWAGGATLFYYRENSNAVAEIDWIATETY